MSFSRITASASTASAFPGQCTLCVDDFTAASPYDTTPMVGPSRTYIVHTPDSVDPASKNIQQHIFHESCALKCFETYHQCPLCPDTVPSTFPLDPVRVSVGSSPATLKSLATRGDFDGVKRFLQDKNASQQEVQEALEAAATNGYLPQFNELLNTSSAFQINHIPIIEAAVTHHHLPIIKALLPLRILDEIIEVVKASKNNKEAQIRLQDVHNLVKQPEHKKFLEIFDQCMLSTTRKKEGRILSFLLQQDGHNRTDYTIQQLLEAAGTGNLEMIRCHFTNYDVSEKNLRNTFLHAMDYFHYNIFTWLLEQQHIPLDLKERALTQLVKIGTNHTSMLGSLLTYSTFNNPSLSNAFISAIRNKNKEAFEMLVDRGFIPRFTPADKASILRTLSLNDAGEMLQCLVEYQHVSEEELKTVYETALLFPKNKKIMAVLLSNLPWSLRLQYYTRDFKRAIQTRDMRQWRASPITWIIGATAVICGLFLMRRWGVTSKFPKVASLNFVDRK